MKKLPTSTMLQPELGDHPARIEADAAEVLNTLGQVTREVLHRAGIPDFERLAWTVIARAQLRLGDTGLITRQVEK